MTKVKTSIIDVNFEDGIYMLFKFFGHLKNLSAKGHKIPAEVHGL